MPLSLSAALARGGARLVVGSATNKPVYARALVQVGADIALKTAPLPVCAQSTDFDLFLPLFPLLSRVATAVSGEVGGDAIPLSHDNRGHQSACHRGAVGGGCAMHTTTTNRLT